MSDLISRKSAIDAIEEVTSSMSVCLTTDEYYGMTRMKGMAIGALIALPSAQPDVADENLQFTEQEKEFLCMLFSLCNEMLGMKGRYMEIGYEPFGHNELFELSQKLKIDY